MPALRADRLDGGTPISLREPKRPTVLLDDLDDSLVSAYNALPERAFAIDAKGRIAWRSAHGPRGLDLGELATAIESLVQAAR